MKKILLLVITIFVLYSCTNDDSDNNTITPNALCETEWNYISPVVDGYQQDLLLYFENQNNVRLILDGFRDGNLVDEDAFDGSYSYTQPNLQMTFQNTLCNGGSIFDDCDLNASINGSVLSLTYDNEIFIFNRVDNIGEPNCNTDPNSAAQYRIEFSGSSTFQQQYPLEITYYSDDINGNLITEVVNSQTNTDIIESKVLEIYDRIGFKIQVNNQSQANIDTVRIIDENQNIVYENFNLSIGIGESFIYTISSDSFTIN